MIGAEQHRTQRSCACGAQVEWPAADRGKALSRVACPDCGREHLFSWFHKMDVALSEACNYRCIMCRRPSDPLTLGKDAVIKVMKESARVGLEVVSFCGGEPFVHRDFLDIAEAAMNEGLKVQLVTNGSLVKPEHMRRLQRLDCFTVSIDGIPDVHDQIRGVAGAWEMAVSALNMALDAGIVAGTNTVIQRDNLDTLWLHYQQLVEATGGRIHYFRSVPVEVVPETADLQIPDDKVEYVRDQLLQIAADCEKRNIFFCHRRQLLEHLPRFIDKRQRFRPLGGCRIPQKFIGYSYLGYYLCWHQGRAIRANGLIEALSRPEADAIVAEAAASQCVGCNAMTYSWDEEWNEGILSGQIVRPPSLPDNVSMIVGSGSQQAHAPKNKLNIVRWSGRANARPDA
jgi:MoaA/NifB/PqqE/SkfB family radical SAM enzyme